LREGGRKMEEWNICQQIGEVVATLNSDTEHVNAPDAGDKTVKAKVCTSSSAMKPSSPAAPNPAKKKNF
jgi:hypothetical protein